MSPTPVRRSCPYAPDASAYLLGALEGEERAAFRAHLDECAACQREVAELRAVTDTLPLAAPPAAPPAALKSAVMAEVRAQAQLLRAAEEPVRARRRSGPARARWPLRRPLRPIGGALAALTLLGAGVVVGLSVSGGGSHSARTIQAQVRAPSASARVELSGGRAKLVMTRLAPPPAGHVYEVWLQGSAGTPKPVATFYAVATPAPTTEDIHGGLAGVRHILVTVEPAPGSRAPTSVPIIDARLN
jgi:anti-sigma factor RsiW